MTDILNLLNQNLDRQVVDQLSSRIGADKETTSKASQGAINILLAAVNKQAQDQNKVSGLMKALQNDHDGSLLDSVQDFARGNTQNINNRTANGAGILSHLLGDRKGTAAQMLAKTSGLDSNKSSSLLETLAPIVMGAVGKQLSGNDPSTSGLQSILQSTMNSRVQNTREQSMLEKLLDQDNDGSVIDDILNMGMNFLKRRK